MIICIHRSYGAIDKINKPTMAPGIVPARRIIPLFNDCPAVGSAINAIVKAVQYGFIQLNFNANP